MRVHPEFENIVWHSLAGAQTHLSAGTEIRSIDAFRFEDIVIAGYQSHPAIKAPIAV